METLFKILDNEAVLGFIISIAGIIIAKIFNAKPDWENVATKYKGTLIAAIKQAEKMIPDDAENKSMQRLDKAMKIALAAIGEGKVTTSSLKEAIQVLHASMEVSGNLGATIAPEMDE